MYGLLRLALYHVSWAEARNIYKVYRRLMTMPAETRVDAELTLDFKASGFDEGGTAHIPFTWRFTQVKQSDVVKMQRVIQSIVSQLMEEFAKLGAEKIKGQGADK